MKLPPLTLRGSLALLAGLVLGTTTTLAGQVVVSNFDDPIDDSLWLWENWSSETLVDFDATLDAGGSVVGSGSMRVTNNFPNNPGGYSQCVITGNLGQTVDAETLYTNISLDIRLDPSSYSRVNGTQYGFLELILRNGSGWDWTTLPGYELSAINTNWTHLNFPVKAPANAVHHLTLKLGENNLTNTVIYNVDNIRWDEAPLNIPPPAMSIEKTKPGLNLLAASGGQYDRQNIKTVNTSYGWIGSSAPMSYSMTIREFPSAVFYPGFTTHFYLVPGTPGTEEYPDWNEANCILIDIRENTNGTATSTFHYKTNAPGSNGKPTLDGKSSQYANSSPTNGPVGQLGSVTSAGILGTWTVSFNQDTNITLVAPDGTSSSMVMPPEDAAQFAGDITVYFGAVPGQTANIGQRAILSGAQIKAGNTTLLEDHFTTEPLDPDLWVVNAASSAGVSLITPAEPFYVYWTTPASGFTLQTNSSLTLPDNWSDPVLTDQLVGTKRRVLVPSSALPAAGQGFFRLFKPQ
jgi:hypothetical protein